MKKSKSQKNLLKSLPIIFSFVLFSAFVFPSFLSAQEPNAKENTAANYAIDSILGAFSTAMEDSDFGGVVTMLTNVRKSTSQSPAMMLSVPDFDLIGNNIIPEFEPPKPDRSALINPNENTIISGQPPVTTNPCTSVTASSRDGEGESSEY